MPPVKPHRVVLSVVLSTVAALLGCADAASSLAPAPTPGAVTSPPAVPPPLAVPVPDSGTATSPRPSATPSRIEISWPDSTAGVHVGDTLRLVARVWFASDSPLVIAAVRWQVGDTTAASLDSVSGAFVAKLSGTSTVMVTVGDTTAWRLVEVLAADDRRAAVAPVPGTTQPTPVVPPPDGGTAAPRSIALEVRRLVSPSQSDKDVVVSGGIPLAAGMLRPDGADALRVVVDGVEQRAYVRVLAGRHRDGSVRSVSIRFPYDFKKPAVSGVLEVGVRPTAPRLAQDPGGPYAVPDAVVFPSEPAYVIGTGLVGPTKTAAETWMLGGTFAKYDADFVTHADKHWAASGAAWVENYYDRALIYFAMWARTGNAEYYRRGALHALAYRRDYLEAGGYNSSPHWSQLEGLAVHYWLTGDEASRRAVVAVADKMVPYIPSEYFTRVLGESRIAARTLHAVVLAWQVLPGGPAVPGLAYSSDYAAHTDRALERLFAWQAADGSWPADGQVCGGQLNYMVGMLNDVLIKTYEGYRADARIVSAVRRGADYLWKTQWLPEARAFKYTSTPTSCTSANGTPVGGPEPAPNLTGLLVAPYGWLARVTGDAGYRAIGDTLFGATVAGMYPTGSKQFNEAYTNSYRYLGYR
jgi:hypothetical protein